MLSSIPINARLETVNAALKHFAPTTTVERGDRGWVVTWVDHRGKTHSRRWAVQSRGSSFPSWESSWGRGGTCCAALTQLMRWLQDRPVFGLGVWKHWASPTIKLGNDQLIQLLQDGGWPETSNCVICKGAIDRTQGLDWWSHLDVEGPVCLHSQSCPNNPKRDAV
jgi:hypothetical protein